MKQHVISREYKVMLNQERFVGSQTDLLKHAEAFWSAFENSIQGIALGTNKSNLDKVDKRRAVRFYDTEDRRLRKNKYVFRERVDLDSGKRKVTLKFRHPDRYVAQDRDMAAADVDEGKTKFEEDIKHPKHPKRPFVRLYSFSTKQGISKDKSLNTLNDLGELYPDLKKRLKPFQKNEPLEIVEGFAAKEIVIKGADFKIGKKPKVKAKCALIAWYDLEGIENEPVVVEFSFKYGHDQEEYDGETARRAHEVFTRLESMPAGWVKPGGTTKTAYAYNE